MRVTGTFGAAVPAIPEAAFVRSVLTFEIRARYSSSERRPEPQPATTKTASKSSGNRRFTPASLRSRAVAAGP